METRAISETKLNVSTAALVQTEAAGSYMGTTTSTKFGV